MIFLPKIKNNFKYYYILYISGNKWKNDDTYRHNKSSKYILKTCMVTEKIITYCYM